MAKSIALSYLSFLLSPSRSPFPSKTTRLLSTTRTPFPLQYDLIINRPPPPSSQSCPPSVRPNDSLSHSTTQPEPDEPEPTSSELGLHTWVDRKLGCQKTAQPELDKSKRKYYNKRRKRMYGSDSDDEGRGPDETMVELKPEVVEFPTLHRREEELYFYDAFTYPWEKEKHYKMVYQLEKKYFPDHCLDKAFLQPGQQSKPHDNNDDNKKNNKKLVFFEGKVEEKKEKGGDGGGGSKDLTEKKVEEFFKGLKKAPNKDPQDGVEPSFSSRRTGLPPIWDGPHGTVLLVNKPKDWTSFTVCGKLRRLVKVKKVGHAGTLDPMATGLLIVCVGKATKLVDRYQGMIKGYSGVFRLGEATSTWDADSPVIQREPWEHIKDEDIRKNASSFCGEIWQVPPMFSAIKVGGEKMYEKARRGESIELSPRRISIFQFDIERSLDDRQNLIFRVTCSKGTYIRSLCSDFGKALGSCAHLTALRRDSIGQYSADDAWNFQELDEAITKSYL